MTSIALDAASGTPVPATSTPSVAHPWRNRDSFVAALALVGILLHLTLKYVADGFPAPDLPLLVVLGVGGSLLLPALAWEAAHGRFGSDQLAAVSMVASALPSLFNR